MSDVVRGRKRVLLGDIAVLLLKGKAHRVGRTQKSRYRIRLSPHPVSIVRCRAIERTSMTTT
jgi:hypothetical protein